MRGRAARKIVKRDYLSYLILYENDYEMDIDLKQVDLPILDIPVTLQELFNKCDEIVACEGELLAHQMVLNITYDESTTLRNGSCTKIIQELYFPILNISINTEKDLNIMFDSIDR